MLLRHGIYAQRNAGNITTDGLVLNMEGFNPACYNNVGNVITDVSVLGNQNNLVKSTAFNNTSKVFEYNGSNSLIYKNNTLSSPNEDYDINKTGEISIEYWINYDQLVRSLDGGFAYGTVFGSAAADHYQWQIGKHTTGSTYRVNFVVRGSGQSRGLQQSDDSYFTPVIPFVAGQWYQFVFSYKKTGDVISMAMNGYDAGGQKTGALTTAPVNPTFTRLEVGGRASGGTYPMLGDLGVFRIYNKVLSPTEILKNYEANKQLFGY